MKPLSPRQRDVVLLIALGMTNKQIALKLGISLGAFKVHASAAYDRLGAANRTQAALMVRT
jgi:DNA-binding NarL/FixJ family response regulator